ncbi:MAG: hypothetical protein DRJ99_03690 [Thermoplasmata archaeon]|nr:MAG: hypothetical protein DRJ99_03690 [Thermoplasmata archaeon]
MKEKEYMPPLLITKLMLKGSLSLAKVLLFNLGTLKKLRRMDPKRIIPETKTKLYNSQIQAWYEIL